MNLLDIIFLTFYRWTWKNHHHHCWCNHWRISVNSFSNTNHSNFHHCSVLFCSTQQEEKERSLQYKCIRIQLECCISYLESLSRFSQWPWRVWRWFIPYQYHLWLRQKWFSTFKAKKRTIAINWRGLLWQWLYCTIVYI